MWCKILGNFQAHEENMISVKRICYNKICLNYHQTSNERHTSVDNNIVDHSDVVGASPVGAAAPTSSFST